MAVTKSNRISQPRLLGQLIAALAVFTLAQAAHAARKDLEIVSLSGNTIPTCNQAISFGISYTKEADNPVRNASGGYELFLLVSPNNASNPLPQNCIDNPYSSGCASRWSLIRLPEKRLFTGLAVPGLPSSHIAVTALSTNTGLADPIMYSKAKQITFQPCTYAPAATILPGTGSIPAVVDLTSDRGAANLYRRTIKPVVKWGSEIVSTIGGSAYPATFPVTVLAYTKNIESIYLTVQSSTGQTGYVHIPGTQVSIDPQTGLPAYVAQINANDWNAGTLTISANYIPLVGRPGALAGALTTAAQRETDTHSITLYNNRNDAIVTPTLRRVSSTGTDTPLCTATSSVPCCGGLTNACRTINGAIRAQIRTVNPSGQGTSNLAGLTIELIDQGPFTVGMTNADYIDAPQYMTIRGRRDAPLPLIDSRTDLTSFGFPDTAWINFGNVRYENLRLKNASGPDMREFILPVSPNVARATEVRNVHFEGVGLDGLGQCLMDTFGLGGSGARVLYSSFSRMVANYSVMKSFQTYISTSSIAGSEIIAFGNMMLEVDHSGKNVGPNGLMVGCASIATAPHGDFLRISARPSVYVKEVHTTEEGNNLGQGLFFETPPALPNVEQALVQNAKFRLLSPGQVGYGNSLLLVNMQHMTLDGVSFLGGPTSPCGSGITSCNIPGVIAVNPDTENANNLLGGDATLTTTSGNFQSPITGIRYRINSAVANPYSIP